MTVGDALPRAGEAAPAASVPRPAAKPSHDSPAQRAPAVIVSVVIAAVVGLSLRYLTWPQPLLVQGEADGTRVDIAARVDGRVSRLPAARGQDVAAGTVLVGIDNPELVAKRDEARAAKAVADAGRPGSTPAPGPRSSPSARPRSSRAAAALTLTQQTYDRVRPLAANRYEPRSKIVLGARVPVVLTSRADNARTRIGVLRGGGAPRPPPRPDDAGGGLSRCRTPSWSSTPAARASSSSSSRPGTPTA